jgi:hypothetical protein
MTGVGREPTTCGLEERNRSGLLRCIGLETRQKAAFQPVADPDSPNRDEWFVYNLSTVQLLVLLRQRLEPRVLEPQAKKVRGAGK